MKPLALVAIFVGGAAIGFAGVRLWPSNAGENPPPAAPATGDVCPVPPSGEPGSNPHAFHGDADPIPPGKPYSGAERGRADAERDLAAGKPVIHRYGEPMLDLLTDPETGLRFHDHGCVVTDDLLRYVAAYNEVVRKAFVDGRLAKPAPR